MKDKELSIFKVTKKAMRPASSDKQCFYCGEKIGSYHEKDCVLINKKALVRLVIDYEVEIPAYWNKSNVNFHRNEGTWCSNNLIDELKDLTKGGDCLCDKAKFKCIKIGDSIYLNER